MAVGPIPRITLACVLLFILSVCNSAQSSEESALLHQPPSEARQGEDLLLVVRAERDTIITGEIYYRSPGGPYSVVPLVGMGPEWSGYIPSEDLTPPGVEYYIRVETVQGLHLTLPLGAAEDRPFFVPVIGQETRVVVLTPQPGEAVDDPQPEIAAIFDPALPDTTSILALLDNRDVTAQAELGIDFFFLASPSPLSSGPHEMRLLYLDENGEPGEARWEFRVRGEERERPSLLTFHGRLETGWSRVSSLAKGSDETYLPYPEGSNARIDFFGYGNAWGRDLFLSINRNPAIEDETRWIFRLSDSQLHLEGGDITPFFSEETIGGLPSTGVQAELRYSRWRTRLVTVRTVEAEQSEFFLSYDQYLVALRQEGQFGNLRGIITGSYGADRESSIKPDSATLAGPFSPPVPIENMVLAAEGELRRGDLTFTVILARSRDESDLVREGWAYRLRVEKQGRRSFSLEFRSYQPNYTSLGNSWMEEGQEGIFATTRWGDPRRFRTSGRLELYRDYLTPQALKGSDPVTLFTWRLDFPEGSLARVLSPFVSLDFYRLPRLADPIERESVSLGTSLDHRLLDGHLSIRYLRDRTGAVSETWSLYGYLGYHQRGDGLTARVRGSWHQREDDRAINDPLRSSYRLPRASLELGYRLESWELRSSAEWLGKRDRIYPDLVYEESLISLLLGYHF